MQFREPAAQNWSASPVSNQTAPLPFDGVSRHSLIARIISSAVSSDGPPSPRRSAKLVARVSDWPCASRRISARASGCSLLVPLEALTFCVDSSHLIVTPTRKNGPVIRYPIANRSLSDGLFRNWDRNNHLTEF